MEKPFEDLSGADIRPGRWYNLLNREPEKIIWPAADLGAHSILLHHADGRRHIQVQQTAYAALGLIEQDSFVWRIDFVRPEWTSGSVGLFLGGRPAMGTTLFCQSIEVHRELSKGQWRMVLERNKLAIDKASARLLPGLTRRLCGIPIDEPVARAPVTVEIQVMHGALSGFRWAGNEVTAITDGRAAANEPLNSFQGHFGVLVEGTAADFDNSQIRFPGSIKRGDP